VERGLVQVSDHAGAGQGGQTAHNRQVGVWSTVVELLWYGFVVIYVLGMIIFVGLSMRTPWCPYCRVQALALARQIGDTSPPMFEVIYRCPRCRAIVWKRLVNALSD
jgi:hypothetical protein